MFSQRNTTDGLIAGLANNSIDGLIDGLNDFAAQNFEQQDSVSSKGAG